MNAGGAGHPSPPGSQEPLLGGQVCSQILAKVTACELGLRSWRNKGPAWRVELMKRCRMSKHVLHTGKHFAVGVKCDAWVICVPLAAVQPARQLGAHPGLVLPGARLALGLPARSPTSA